MIIISLKVTTILAPTATPVAPSVGLKDKTVGTTVSTVIVTVLSVSEPSAL